MDRIKKEIDQPKYESLAELVTKATQKKLERFAEKILAENLGSQIIGTRELTCINARIHKIQIVTYDDSSIWIKCPMFGWFEETGVVRSRRTKLGCKHRKKRCTWFIG